MSRDNYFFKLTETQEEYTEEYLLHTVSNIVASNENIGFEELYKRVQEAYEGVKINRSAFLGLAYSEFGILNDNKGKKDTNKRNYFFSLQDLDEQHTETYLVIQINECLGEEKLTKEEIFARVLDRYANEKLNYSAFKKLLDERFPSDGKFYIANTDVRKTNNMLAMKKEYPEDSPFWGYKKTLSEYGNENLLELYRLFYNNLETKPLDVMGNIPLAMAIIALQSNEADMELYADLCTTINEYLPAIISRLDKAILGGSQSNDCLFCSSIFKNDTVVRFLGAYGIVRIADIKKTNARVLLPLVCVDYQNVIERLEMLSADYVEVLAEKIENLVSLAARDDRTLDVLFKRAGYFTQVEKTLDEIAVGYRVTRERVRQIEAKGKRRFEKIVENSKQDLVDFFDLVLKYNEKKFSMVSALCADHDEDSILNACLLLDNTEISYKYDRGYHLIYNSEQTSIKEIENDVFERYGKIVPQPVFDEANELDQLIISHHYKLSGRDNNVFIQEKYSMSEYMIDLIIELFPNGYEIYNEEAYAVLRDEFIRRLGDEVEIPSQVAIRGKVSWKGGYRFCLIDKGTYKLRSKCTELPSEFISRIFDFIVDNLPMVDYTTIFEHFKTELGYYGINNRYYLKGVIDPTLPDDVTTARDYITETNNVVSATQARIDYMRSFKGEFTMEDLQKEFPGVKPYVFINMAMKEEKNGLIQITGSRFIYDRYLSISESQKLALGHVLQELFQKTGLEVLSSKKVYAKCKLSYPELLHSLPFSEEHATFFAIVKYLLKDQYYFDRHFVSQKKPDQEGYTVKKVILDYVTEHDVITYGLYRDFCLKMNITMVFSFMSMTEELSDDYVQIDGARLVKKDSINISEGTLKDIQRLLEMIFGRTDVIDTATFNGYMLFPQFKYGWNKHVLAGVVRSYFGDDYEVTNITSGNKLEADNYVIKRYSE